MTVLGFVSPDRSPFDFDPVHSLAFGLLAAVFIYSGFFAKKGVGRRMVGGAGVAALSLALMNFVAPLLGVTAVMGAMLSPALGALELISGGLALGSALLTLED
jgi:hydrogenase-4 membrane subunit HyfE